MLSRILALLRERGALSVQEISLALTVDADALYPMLELLEGKGRITRIEIPCKSGCAGGCHKSDAMTFYRICTSPAEAEKG